MSTTQMLASGLKGKGFSVLHTYQDHLWWVHCFFYLQGKGGGSRDGENVSLRFRSASIGLGPSSCNLWTPDFHPLAKYIFLVHTRNRDSFGYFLGLELSQTIALDLGIVCLALHCGDVHIVLISLTLSIMCILDIIWS